MTPDMDSSVAKPKKDEHAVRISTKYTLVAQKLAANQNAPFAEILTKAVEAGLDQLVERETRMNIWMRTSQKAEIITLLDDLPQERYEEAIAKLKEMSKG